jgi:hypothetical protein
MCSACIKSSVELSQSIKPAPGSRNMAVARHVTLCRGHVMERPMTNQNQNPNQRNPNEKEKEQQGGQQGGGQKPGQQQQQQQPGQGGQQQGGQQQKR